MNAWIASLTPSQLAKLLDLAFALKMSPHALALHLLDREHERVFGNGADEDPVTQK